MAMERPILFSGDMVRAILDGRKTQTRRVIKPQPLHPPIVACYRGGHTGFYGYAFGPGTDHNAPDSEFRLCPYGRPAGSIFPHDPGDRLWVRETFFIDDLRYFKGQLPKKWPDDLPKDALYYRADGTCCDQIPECDHDNLAQRERSEKQRFRRKDNGPAYLRPSIHMPRWASRITLEVVKVRVERVRDISEGDAIAEGWHPGIWGDKPHAGNGGPFDWFRSLWDSLNAKRGFGWDANPWVWVVEFRRLPGGGDPDGGSAGATGGC